MPTEGDGGLHCYKYSKSCLFGLTQKEEPILQEIQSVLGFGKVYFYISANVYRYRVTTKSENLKLAILFNGKLATIKKINQLKLWIDVLNADYVKLTFNPNPFYLLWKISGYLVLLLLTFALSSKAKEVLSL